MATFYSAIGNFLCSILIFNFVPFKCFFCSLLAAWLRREIPLVLKRFSLEIHRLYRQSPAGQGNSLSASLRINQKKRKANREKKVLNSLSVFRTNCFLPGTGRTLAAAPSMILLRFDFDFSFACESIRLAGRKGILRWEFTF